MQKAKNERKEEGRKWLMKQNEYAEGSIYTRRRHSSASMAHLLFINRYRSRARRVNCTDVSDQLDTHLRPLQHCVSEAGARDARSICAFVEGASCPPVIAIERFSCVFGKPEFAPAGSLRNVLIAANRIKINELRCCVE